MGIDFILTDRSDWNVVFVNGGFVYVNTAQSYCSLTQPIWKVCTSQTSLSQQLLFFFSEPCTFLANQNKPFAFKESILTCLRFVCFLILLLFVCLLFCKIFCILVFFCNWLLLDAIAFLGEGQISESESNVNLKNPVGIGTCRDFFWQK